MINFYPILHLYHTKVTCNTVILSSISMDQMKKMINLNKCQLKKKMILCKISNRSKLRKQWSIFILNLTTIFNNQTLTYQFQKECYQTIFHLNIKPPHNNSLIKNQIRNVLLRKRRYLTWPVMFATHFKIQMKSLNFCLRLITLTFQKLILSREW